MISNSYLLGLYGLSSSTGMTAATSSALAAAAKKQPTPPWSTTAEAPKADALVRAALGGRKLIDEGAAKLDLASASADYKKLFALYRGLESLNALTNRAATKGVSALELAQLNRRFSSGLDEISQWLTSADFDATRIVQGKTASVSKTSAGIPRDSAVSITGPVHEGDPDAASPAFAGDVAFDITVRTGSGAEAVTKTIAIDLNDMGGQTRSLTNVLAHINGKLEAAGVETRLGREKLAAEPKTVTLNGRTVTLPAGADRYGLIVRGVSSETVGFQASAEDAVYVVQAAGASGQQVLKFQADTGGTAADAQARAGETFWVDGRQSQTALPPGVEAVRASATGPDGSLWLVADLSAGPNNQPIKGQRDVALMKLDSAGRVVSTQALGAASTASGYAIAVGSDGRVAVAGSVTGALEPGKSGDVATVADSFVSVFDGDGQEVWTQRRGARAADEATAVSFGQNGTVIVAGRAQSAMPGAGASGGWDGYVQSFSETQEFSFSPVVAKTTGVAQFGTAAEDSVTAMTVDGSDLYTAGVENGRMVLRKFALGADGRPTLTSTRDLGGAGGGSISSLAVADGRLIVTGATRNDALDAGAVNAAHHGGIDAFVASLDTTLSAGAGDRLTYIGGAGDDSATDAKVHDGKVWLTGVADRPEGAKATDPSRGYLARIDPASGAVEWRREWDGDGQQARPATLAVASGGASVLDRLGLPMGEIDQSPSKSLTTATTLRVGDRFYVSPADGGRQVAVTIEARDTLQTLARKIEQASGRKLKVTVASEAAKPLEPGQAAQALFNGVQRLSITSRDGKTGAVLTAGEPGRDALAGLGLTQGYVGPTATGDDVKTFGLNLSRNLTLQDAAAVKSTGEAIQAAMKAVRDAYRALAPQPPASQATGAAPAYLTAQLANYQAALARLGG